MNLRAILYYYLKLKVPSILAIKMQLYILPQMQYHCINTMILQEAFTMHFMCKSNCLINQLTTYFSQLHL